MYLYRATKGDALEWEVENFAVNQSNEFGWVWEGGGYPQTFLGKQTLRFGLW